jgi:catalase
LTSPDLSKNITRADSHLPGIALKGDAARHPYTHPNSDYIQPRTLYERVMTDVDRDHLIGNIVDNLSGAKKEIQLRQTAIFYKVHEDYGTRVARDWGWTWERSSG